MLSEETKDREELEAAIRSARNGIRYVGSAVAVALLSLVSAIALTVADRLEAEAIKDINRPVSADIYYAAF